MSTTNSDQSGFEKKRSAKSYSSSKPAVKNGSSKSSSSYSDKMLKAIKISQEELGQLVAQKAYELFESRGYQHGRDLEDWVEAEKTVREQVGL